VVVEDLHWVDGASSAVLGDLVADVRARAYLFIVTARPGRLPAWFDETIELDPLPQADARKLVDLAFEQPVSGALADTVELS
jgi:predicted ATPase